MAGLQFAVMALLSKLVRSISNVCSYERYTVREILAMSLYYLTELHFCFGLMVATSES